MVLAVTAQGKPPQSELLVHPRIPGAHGRYLGVAVACVPGWGTSWVPLAGHWILNWPLDQCSKALPTLLKKGGGSDAWQIFLSHFYCGASSLYRWHATNPFFHYDGYQHPSAGGVGGCLVQVRIGLGAVLPLFTPEVFLLHLFHIVSPFRIGNPVPISFAA